MYYTEAEQTVAIGHIMGSLGEHGLLFVANEVNGRHSATGEMDLNIYSSKNSLIDTMLIRPTENSKAGAPQYTGSSPIAEETIKARIIFLALEAIAGVNQRLTKVAGALVDQAIPLPPLTLHRFLPP